MVLMAYRYMPDTFSQTGCSFYSAWPVAYGMRPRSTTFSFSNMIPDTTLTGDNSAKLVIRPD